MFKSSIFGTENKCDNDPKENHYEQEFFVFFNIRNNGTIRKNGLSEKNTVQ